MSAILIVEIIKLKGFVLKCVIACPLYLQRIFYRRHGSDGRKVKSHRPLESFSRRIAALTPVSKSNKQFVTRPIAARPRVETMRGRRTYGDRANAQL